MRHTHLIVLMTTLLGIVCCGGEKESSLLGCNSTGEAIHLEPPLTEEGAYTVSVHSSTIDGSCTANLTATEELTHVVCDTGLGLLPDSQATVTNGGAASPGPMYGIGTIGISHAPDGEAFEIRVERDGHLVKTGTVTPVDAPAKVCSGHQPQATLSLTAS